jgi:hypothetical protein
MATLPSAPVASQESSLNFPVNLIGNIGNRKSLEGTKKSIVGIGVFPFLKGLVKKNTGIL